MTEKRVKRYNIRLSGSMPERLEAIAEDRGIAPSTFISFIVGDYVATQEIQMDHVKRLMGDPNFISQVQKTASKNDRLT